MAVIETTRSHISPVAVIGHVFARLTHTFTNWNSARVTRNALVRLSDRELNDIGISRGEIDRIVRHH